MATVTIREPDPRGLRIDVSFDDRADAERTQAYRWRDHAEPHDCGIRVRSEIGSRLTIAEIAFAREAAARVADEYLDD